MIFSMSIKQEGQTYVQQLYDKIQDEPYKEQFTDFLGTIARLNIEPSHIQGPIAVIGQAQFFPERSLLCYDDNYENLKPEISFLACIDSSFFSNPERSLNTQVTIHPNSKKN